MKIAPLEVEKQENGEYTLAGTNVVLEGVGEYVV